MAGAAGIEPALAVLETAVLPLNYAPTIDALEGEARYASFTGEATRKPPAFHLTALCIPDRAIPPIAIPFRAAICGYFASLKVVCLRSTGLYFFNSSFSVVFFLFLVVV